MIDENQAVGWNMVWDKRICCWIVAVPTTDVKTPESKTVARISRRFFTHKARFAVTEMVAHLCCLVKGGRLAEDTGANGVMCFGRG